MCTECLAHSHCYSKISYYYYYSRVCSLGSIGSENSSLCPYPAGEQLYERMMAGGGGEVCLGREKLSPHLLIPLALAGKGRKEMGREVSLTPACTPPLFWSWKGGMGKLGGPEL